MNNTITYPEKKGGPTNPWGVQINAWPTNDADPKIDWQWEIDITPSGFPLEAREAIIEALNEVQKMIDKVMAETEPGRNNVIPT